MMQPGIHSGIPMKTYISDPCPEPSVSTGVVLNLTGRSPKHAWTEHPRLGKQNSDSRRADIGSAGHAALLGGDERLVYAPSEFEDWKKKDARLFRDGAYEKGQIPLLDKDRRRVAAMADKAKLVLGRFGKGLCEQTIIWQDELGVWGKSRPDFIADDLSFTLDYKTADNADPQGWVRRVLFAGGYDVQAALVHRGLDQLKGEMERGAYFLIQEIDPPFECSVVLLSSEAAHYANAKVVRALSMWRTCLDNKQWPGYIHASPETAYYADLPAWLMRQSEERSHD